MLKRTFDLILSALGLVILAPVFLVCAIWIKVDSAGPVYFRQVRVGRVGSTFLIHKFRTMLRNAESRGEQLTAAGDPRVTHCGAFLRRHKLDELPQLIDVLVGHMSLVGPRPEVPQFVAHYPDDVRRIVLSVKPGITDLASVRFSNESALLAGKTNADFYVAELLPQKLKYYVEYVGTQSLRTDIKIIFLTLKALVS